MTLLELRKQIDFAIAEHGGDTQVVTTCGLMYRTTRSTEVMKTGFAINDPDNKLPPGTKVFVIQ